MKDELAEKLLVTVLDWDGIRSKEELPCLQNLARYKYDEYQQFAPGMRFVESLTRWLFQFEREHRETAYQFVREKLIFCSSLEIEHLVGMANRDRIRPHLVQSAAEECGCDPRHIARIVNSTQFRIRLRQCLFLGLSDGARIDMFRRANNFDLSHEQILQTHELSDDRIDMLLDNLKEDLHQLSGDDVPPDPVFRTVVLLDDFSASGLSYYMPNGDGSIGGKIARFHKVISNPTEALSRLFHLKETEVFIVLYVASEQARQHLQNYSRRIWEESVAHVHVEVVQLLPNSIRMTSNNCGHLHDLIREYYDESIHDEHLKRGGTADARYGFAACGLPLVMHHNTPNNSIALLWSYDDTDVPGLFPRVRRHGSTT